MQQKAAEEFIERQGQQLLFVVVGGVAPTECDFVIRKGNQAMVGDGHAMGVPAQILEYVFWASKGSFGINHPVVPEQRPEPGGKSLWLSKQLQFSMEIQLAILESTPEGCNELAAKNTPEHLNGKKERVV